MSHQDPRWLAAEGSRTRMDTLRAGQRFTCSQGELWTYVRRDGALSGVHHCEKSTGEHTIFAGCAEVVLDATELQL